MNGETKHIIRDSKGNGLLECYSLESVGISYIKIPERINDVLISKGIKIVVKGPNYTL